MTIRLHHVQVACPPGGETASRRFYVDGLGLTEVEKPEDLRGRGGAWFRAYDEHGAVAAELHVGVEDPFVPVRKAHPAFVVDDLGVTAEAVAVVGGDPDWSQRRTFDGYERFHVNDPHGNRVEVLQALADRPATGG
jgi:catechol 2,3-dioxygenase-like lactoylglutathione lyase family enzyme